MAYHALAIFFALLMPVLLFVSRTVVRQQRSSLYLDVIAALFPDDHLPQLDLIGAKYDATAEVASKPDLSRRRRAGGLPLLAAALIYAGVCLCGFELLLTPIGWLIGHAEPSPAGWDLTVGRAFLWTAGGEDIQAVRNAVAVTGMAFLGAYVAGIRFLVRQTLNYELGGASFVRATLLLIMGIVIGLVAFRTLSEGAAFSYHVVRPPTGPANSAPAGWWLGAGFLLGMSPEAGLAWLSRRLRLSFQKTDDEGFFDKVKTIPVEIIDGVDSEIAYRLNQTNIEDIQNLATANPIQLYVETPYGLFEVFDWVLQAQLCLVTGADLFLALKKHGIRTILDLERAILSEEAPQSYVAAIGDLLFSKPDGPFAKRVESPAQGDSWVDVVRHATAIVCDDLHVHRLRTLWLRIQERSWPSKAPSEWIYRQSPLPGDRDYAGPGGVTSPVEVWIALAGMSGRSYAALRASGAPPADLAGARTDALTGVTRALAADQRARDRLRDMWKPDRPGGPKDLATFYDDPDFQALLGLPEDVH